jgi:hypothetical protein
VYLDVGSAAVLNAEPGHLIHGHFAAALEPPDTIKMARFAADFPAVISVCPSRPLDVHSGYSGPDESLVKRLAAFYLRHGPVGAAEALTVSGDEDTAQRVAEYVSMLNTCAQDGGYATATVTSLPQQLQLPQAGTSERPTMSPERFGPLGSPPGTRSPHGRAQPGGGASGHGPDGSRR